MFHLTLGNCLENSSARFLGSGKPVSKYPLKVTGAVPQVAALVTAPLLAAAVDPEELPPGPPQAAAARIPPTASAARAPLGRPVRNGCELRSPICCLLGLQTG